MRVARCPLHYKVLQWHPLYIHLHPILQDFQVEIKKKHHWICWCNITGILSYNNGDYLINNSILAILNNLKPLGFNESKFVAEKLTFSNFLRVLQNIFSFLAHIKFTIIFHSSPKRLKCLHQMLFINSSVCVIQT